MAVTTKAEILDLIVKPAITEKLAEAADKVTLAASIVDDLDADSLDIVEIGMAVEELTESEAGVKLEIKDEDMEKIKTVGDLVNALAEKLDIAA